MRKITGQKDPQITLLRDLLTEDGRRKNGLFFIEGNELSQRAFDFGGEVEGVLMTEKFAASEQSLGLLERTAARGLTPGLVTEGLLSKILDAKPTPECIVIARRKTISLKDALSGDNAFSILVEKCENADNLGMLLRSVDASGVDSVILAGGTTDPFARKVVRGSRGAVVNIPICISPDTGAAIKMAKGNNVRIIATSANTDQYFSDIDFRKPTMIVVGNEHTGISEEMREAADAVVRIPMMGKVNSLNIAVAASIMLYEVQRQRGF